MRCWALEQHNAFVKAALAGELVRVWRGQGHESTIGFVELLHVGRMSVDDMTASDVALEGWPCLSVDEFYHRFFVKPCGAPWTKKHKLNPPPHRTDQLTHVVFRFISTQDDSEQVAMTAASKGPRKSRKK